MTITKFEIETTFSTGKEGYDPERESYERKIEIVRKDAHDAGFNEGHAQALTEIEAKTQETLGNVHIALGELFERRAEVERNLEIQSIQLSHLIAKKLVSSLIKKHPTQEIEELIQDCLTSGYNEPKIIIRSSEVLLQSLTKRIEELVQTTGFQGELSIIPDPNLSSFDCTIEWPNGGVTRNIRELEKQIQNKVQLYIEGPMEEAAVQLVEDNLRASEETQTEEKLSVQDEENEITCSDDNDLDTDHDEIIEASVLDTENQEDNQG